MSEAHPRQLGLRLLEVEITTSCNKSCSICYLGDELNTSEMSLRDVQRLVREAIELGVQRIVLTGGEPLLHSKFESIVAAVNRLGVRPGVLTNGTTLTRSKGANLTGNVSFIQLSLHDLPSHDASALSIVERVGTLKEMGAAVTVLVTLSAQNLVRLGGLLDLVTGLNVPAGFQRFCSVAGKSLDAFAMNPEAYELAMREMWERMQGNDNLSCEDPLLNRCMADKYLMSIPEPTWIGCSAGRWAAVISANGDLMPCAKLRISDANVFDTGLAESWNTSEILRSLREDYAGSVCESCKYFGVCRGCRAEAYQAGRGLWGSDPLCPGPIAWKDRLQ